MLRPTDPAGMSGERLRKLALAALAPPAAIWTIEQAPGAPTLHLNIICPRRPSSAPRWTWSWSTDVGTDVRRIAAYIGKRQQAPDPATHPGRCFGFAGPLWLILARCDQAPAVQAAAWQYQLDEQPMLAAAAETRSIRPPEPDTAPPDYRTIAARYLPDLLHRLAPNRPK